MGACYSKTGHGTDMSSNDHLPYEKVTSNNHQRNGHARKDDYEAVQTNEDYENRTPQTSLGVDANKNVNPNSKDLIQDKSEVPEDAETQKMDYMDAVPIENTVTQSDSGIVVEPIPRSPDHAICLKNEQNTGSVRYQHYSDLYNDKDSTNQQEPVNELLETGRVLNLPLNLHIQSSTSDYVQTSSTFTPTPDSDLDDVHEGGSRTDKSDSSRGETTANIAKIRQAIHRSTLPSPADYSRSITEPIEIGDRPSSSLSTLGPGEVATMTIDGREVVLIDAEVYAQILEEIAFLKLKLSQLTQVIQEDEEGSRNRTTENLEDSMVAESVSYS